MPAMGSFKANTNVTVVEATTILRGIRFVIESSLVPAIIESNAKQVTIDNWQLMMIWEEQVMVHKNIIINSQFSTNCPKRILSVSLPCTICIQKSNWQQSQQTLQYSMPPCP
ncbi:hypothetical protein Q3G72_028863 [Acer saccharum]|nr:hypothetical protein Q3G72_028863 [Acer saccharum]